MYIHFPTIYSELWTDLAEMVLSNYSEENYNDCVLLCPHKLISNIPYLREIYPNTKIIGYNLEPVHEEHWISIEWLTRMAKEVDEIWDYDKQNIEKWKARGISAKFKPIQYAKSLERVTNLEEPDIDVLFVGTPTTYRGEYISGLLTAPFLENEIDLQSNLKIISAYQIFGKLRDELIGRSKIILNLGPYKDTRQQQARVAYALNNRKCVLSEKTEFNYFDDLIVEFETPTDLAAKMRYLVKDDNWKQYTNKSFEEYCKRKYK